MVVRSEAGVRVTGVSVGGELRDGLTRLGGPSGVRTDGAGGAGDSGDSGESGGWSGVTFRLVVHFLCALQPPHQRVRSPWYRLRHAHVRGSLVRLTRSDGICVGPVSTGRPGAVSVRGGSATRSAPRTGDWPAVAGPGGTDRSWSCLAATLYPGMRGTGCIGVSMVSCSRMAWGLTLAMFRLSSVSREESPLQLNCMTLRTS